MKKIPLFVALFVVAGAVPLMLGQGAGVSSSATPGNGQASATSNHPNSQSPSTAQSPNTEQAPSAAGASRRTNAGAPSAAEATGSAMGENPSSAPQNPGSATSETNMAGQGSATSQSTPRPPANAGSAGSVTTGVGLNDAATLQSQIQNALQNEPTLKNDSLNVSVNDSIIELSGNVLTGKEKQTAYRIASSFAENRRVRDRIAVNGKGGGASTPSASATGSNPSTTPNGTVGNPTNPQNPKNQQNPSANNPAANGDASTTPR